MIMSNKTYDKLKWCLLVLEPALVTLISGLGVALDLDTALVVTIIGLVSAFLGAITGISGNKYNETPIDSDTSEDDDLLKGRDE